MLLYNDCYIVVDCQHCCFTPGPVNPAGDTLRSIADSLGQSDVLRYLESLGSDLKCESVLFVNCCDDVMILGVSPQSIVITVHTNVLQYCLWTIA